MIPISRFNKPQEQDNGFLSGVAKILPIVGAVGGGIAGGVAGSAAPGVGTTMGAIGGSSAGMGLGSGIGGLLSKAPQQQQEQAQGVGGSDGAFARRMQSLRQSSDNNLQQLKQAAIALPQMPPEVRAEAAKPIMTALISDAYGRPVRS